VDTSQTIIVKPASELGASDIDAWTDMRAANPALYSPYFHPDYTRLIGALRADAYVAIAMQGDKYVAFFPYQGPKPGGSGFARPIGAPMTDYHGFICAPDAVIDPAQFLADAGIGALHFSGFVQPGAAIAPYIKETHDCTMMDISSGAEEWRKARDSSYSRHLKSHRRRVRKASEEIGEPRFVYKSEDQAVFDDLIKWKKQKFAETGKFDVLSAGWTLSLLEDLWKRGPEAGLRTDMHALYFGDRLAAVDLGLTDGVTFHSWIVAYDGELHTYAPGIQLLEGLVDAAQDEGYARIDLGEGLDGYKRQYASTPVQIGGGFAAVKGPAAALSSLYGATERLGQKALKDAPGKLRRRYSQIAACEDTVSGRARAIFDAVKTSSK